MRLSDYRFGRIEVEGVPWHEDIWVCAGRVGRWQRKEGHRVHPEDLEDVLPLVPEVVVIGTGAMGMVEVTPAVKDFLAQKGIELVVLPTKEAVERYNELSQKRRVAALLHLTC